jgi:hypothetical protein
MKLTAQAIRFRTSVLVFTALLVVAGIWSYSTLPKEASPSIQFPILTVTTLYAGASPPEVETLVTFPIERELQGLDGLDEIRSVSREGVSVITVEFRTDVDRDDASRRVRERVDLARPELPADADEPRVREIDFEELPVVTVNLVASYPLARLKRVAEALQDDIEGVPGVLEAEITGGVEREVHIDVDLVALHSAGISFDDVVRAIDQENVSIPGGAIDVDRLSYQVRVDGRIEEADRIADLIVAVRGGVPIYVRDVAAVTAEAYAEPDSYARLREVRPDHIGETAAAPARTAAPADGPPGRAVPAATAGAGRRLPGSDLAVGSCPCGREHHRDGPGRGAGRRRIRAAARHARRAHRRPQRDRRGVRAGTREPHRVRCAPRDAVAPVLPRVADGTAGGRFHPPHAAARVHGVPRRRRDAELHHPVLAHHRARHPRRLRHHRRRERVSPPRA